MQDRPGFPCLATFTTGLRTQAFLSLVSKLSKQGSSDHFITLSAILDVSSWSLSRLMPLNLTIKLDRKRNSSTCLSLVPQLCYVLNPCSSHSEGLCLGMGQTVSSHKKRGSCSSIAPLTRPHDTSFLGEPNHTSDQSNESVTTFLSSASVLSDSENGISRPARPPSLYRVSGLIDPHDLFRSYSDEASRRSGWLNVPLVMTHQAMPDVNKRLPPLIESPHGNVLGTGDFLERPDRPLAIRERQESIRNALDEAKIVKINAREYDWFRHARPTSGGAQSSISNLTRRKSSESSSSKSYQTAPEKVPRVQIPKGDAKRINFCIPCF